MKKQLNPKKISVVMGVGIPVVPGYYSSIPRDYIFIQYKGVGGAAIPQKLIDHDSVFVQSCIVNNEFEKLLKQCVIFSEYIDFIELK